MRKKKVIDDLFAGSGKKAISGKPLFSSSIQNATVNVRTRKHNMDESLSNYFIEESPLFLDTYEGICIGGSLESAIQNFESDKNCEISGYNKGKNYAIESEPSYLLFYENEDGKVHYMDRRTGNPKGKGECKEIKISDAELSPGKCKTYKTALKLLKSIAYSKAAMKEFNNETLLGVKRCYRYKDVKSIIKRPKADFNSLELFSNLNTKPIYELLEFVESCYEYKEECKKRGLKMELSYEDRDLMCKGLHYLVQWTVPTSKDFNLGLNIEFNKDMEIVPTGQKEEEKVQEPEKVKVFAEEREVHREGGYKRRRFDPSLDIRGWELSIVRYDLPNKPSQFPMSEADIREILSKVKIDEGNKPVILYQNKPGGSTRIEKFGNIGKIHNILNFKKGSDALIKRSLPKGNSLPNLLSNFNSFMSSGKYKKLPNWKEGECYFYIAEFERVHW